MSGVPKLPYLAGRKNPSPLAGIDEDLIAATPPDELYRCTTVRALATRSDLCKLLKSTPDKSYALDDTVLKAFWIEHGIETPCGMKGTMEHLARLELVSRIDVFIRSSMKRVAVKYKWRKKGEPLYMPQYIEA